MDNDNLTPTTLMEDIIIDPIDLLNGNGQLTLRISLWSDNMKNISAYAGSEEGLISYVGSDFDALREFLNDEVAPLLPAEYNRQLPARITHVVDVAESTKY